MIVHSYIIKFVRVQFCFQYNELHYDDIIGSNFILNHYVFKSKRFYFISNQRSDRYKKVTKLYMMVQTFLRLLSKQSYALLQDINQIETKYRIVLPSLYKLQTACSLMIGSIVLMRKKSMWYV